MDDNTNSIGQLINELISIKDYSARLEKRFSEELLLVHPEMKKSALNLLHYIALRKADISTMQRKLGEMGLSRLAKTESHVMAGVNSVLAILNLLQGKETKSEVDFISFDEGDQLLDKNSEALLGGRSEGRRVRIMVTLPDEAGDDYSIIENLLISGMDCARINCAHGDTTLWSKIIENVKKGNKELNKNCKINMDLCGPKLRTGSMTPGPQVLHIQPERDPMGKVTNPAVVSFIPDNEPPALNSLVPQIPLPAGFLKNLSKGDKLVMTDSRGKEIVFKVSDREGKTRTARCSESAYIITGAKIIVKNDKTKKTKSAKIGYLKPLEGSIKLKKGDTLILHKDDRAGEPAVCDQEGLVTTPAHISCTLPEVFEDVRTGEPILLDDGKIEGIIKTVSTDFIEIEITYAKAAGTTLRADKGINLPGSNLRIKGLTLKDKDDLKFIAANADIVSLSFVNTAQDVLELYNELKLLNSSIGIILKIETQRAFDNLPDILLTGMRSYPFGIMIARGDLAVECGWNHLAEIQEEILMLCEASHVPNIWATQVLETLAKKGRPSRAEITDAAMSQRAECVMLNKGPHIFDAVILLDKILTGMQGYQRKKKPMLPTLKLPHVFES